ncbi:hypothetical protein Ahy_A07g035137 [Arachis hypogaea]|uniref:Uncharacterized protein n=1 Tax=Arachis hypogaea TaxID=3818 RepID=A0A445CDE0_ARAHY|nr:hypothetical protein Ahy_A07g035137 [Arachis hypogaea]
MVARPAHGGRSSDSFKELLQMVESSEINRSLLALLDENIADAHRSNQKQAAKYMEKLRGLYSSTLQFNLICHLREIPNLVRFFPTGRNSRLGNLEVVFNQDSQDMEQSTFKWMVSELNKVNSGKFDGRLKDQLRNDNFSSLERQLIETKEAIERQRKLFKKIQYGIILLPLLYLVHCFLKLEGRA